MHRKKPTGEEWVDFEGVWASSNHEGKLKLAKRYGVTYDTAKHWYSERDTTPKVEASKEESKEEEQLLAVGEVLALQPRVHLDFVSFDLETSNLRADFAILLTACIKPYGKEPMTFRADDYDWNDRQIATDIGNELARHAIVVTHYGTGFDVRFLRAKMIEAGVPPLPPMFGVDTYLIAKTNMLVSRRRLEALAEYLSLGKKSSVEGRLWMEAAYHRSKPALDEILKHNIVDCQILERLATLLFPYLRSIRRL